MEHRELGDLLVSEIGSDHSSRNEIRDRMEHLNQRRTIHRRRLATGGVVTTVAAVVGTVWIVGAGLSTDQGPIRPGQQDRQTVQILEPTRAACYATVDVDDPTNHVNVAVGRKAGKPAPSVQDYFGVCTRVWQTGELQTRRPFVNGAPQNPNSDAAPLAAPALVACAAGDDALAVFPGTDAAGVCAEVGLPVAGGR